MANTSFETAEPFPHAVIDGLLPEEMLLRASEEFALVAAHDWHRYDGQFEKGKAACNRWEAMPPACKEILEWMSSETAAAICSAFTGIRGLRADPTLYGGGLHATESGGFLGLHLDNEVHPQTGLARRLNLIVYCNPDWHQEWGGDLELWDRGRRGVAKRIAPLFNRGVIFETSAYSFHGHTEPLRCPPDVKRKSLAVYFWSALRRRAGFVAAHDEHLDERSEAERLERSM